MRRILSRTFIILFLIQIAAIHAFAADTVKETMLPNGLRVLTKEVHAAPVLTVQVWYRVGSRNEYEGITGSSHLLEHMMFKGSKLFKKGEMSKTIRRMGGVDNAGTWTDFTQYWELLSSEHLEFALKAEADRMVNSLIDPKEFKAEMVVVRSELEGRENSPDSLLWDAVTAAGMQAHPYHWPVIGWRSDVEGISRNELYQHYKDFYHPNNATLLIVGDFDTAKALQMVRKYFGPLAPGPKPQPVRTVEPPQYGERLIKVERPGSAERVLMAYHIPAISSPDTFPLIVLDQIMSGGKSSRLYQALVQAGLATEAYTSVSPRIDPSLFYVGATARAGKESQEIEEELLGQVDQIQKAPPTDEELTRAKNQLESSFIFSKDSVSDQAEQLGYYETVADWRLVDQYVPKVKAVTAQQVREVAEKYLTEMNRTVGWFVPSTAAPEAPSSGTEVSSLPWARQMAGYRELPQQAAKTVHKPVAPKPVVTSAAVSASKVKPFRTVLPNGIVVIVQENHSNSTISIRGNLKAGGVFDPAGKNGLASITAAMLSRGTVTHTSLQLAKIPESVGASVSVSGGTEASNFSVSSLSKDFRMSLDILSDMLRYPNFPQDELDKLKAQVLSGLDQEKESPEQMADRAFRGAVFPAGHPYHQQTVEQDQADAKSITRDDVLAFYQKYYGPDTMIISIAGDIDHGAALQAVQDYFGAWATKGVNKIEIPSVPLQETQVQKVVPMMDKSEVDIVFGHAGMLARNNPDFYAANVMNQVLGGGGALNSRLGTSIRENMGLVYDVYSTFEPTLGEGPWYVALGTNPTNADKAIKALRAEVAKMADKGATAAEEKDAVDFLTGYFPIRLETNGGVAQTLLNAEFYGLGMDYIQNYSKLYHAVTLQQVNAAAKKYLHPDKATLVIAGPYKEPK